MVTKVYSHSERSEKQEDLHRCALQGSKGWVSDKQREESSSWNRNCEEEKKGGQSVHVGVRVRCSHGREKEGLRSQSRLVSHEQSREEMESEGSLLPSSHKCYSQSFPVIHTSTFVLELQLPQYSQPVWHVPPNNWVLRTVTSGTMARAHDSQHFVYQQIIRKLYLIRVLLFNLLFQKVYKSQVQNIHTRLSKYFSFY